MLTCLTGGHVVDPVNGTDGVGDVYFEDGRIVARIPLPITAPTMPCFGGADMRTLFVTSLRATRDGQDRPGALISFRVDVAGLPACRFGEGVQA